MLNRDQILKTVTLKSKTVQIHEWDGSVVVRELTGRQRMEFINKIKGENADPIAAQSWVLTETVYNENGERMFLPEDVSALIETQGIEILNRLFDVVKEISGMGEKAHEDAEKNS